jgi:hypothetical protein
VAGPAAGEAHALPAGAAGCRKDIALEGDTHLFRGRDRGLPAQAHVTWIEADVTDEWPVPAVDIWHDRAVFHFLIRSEDRSRYVAHLRQSVKAHGTVIIAAFALDGPERCSGLPVQRYSGKTLGAELGVGFELVETVSEAHRTPLGAVQSFCYSRFRRVDP